MKKSKLQNTITVDITGKLITPNLYTSNAGSFLPGDILDANSTMDKISETVALNDLNSRMSLAEITCAELKELRDNSNLVPGKQYRITDYVTTTMQENTRSAGHLFDIIVRADSKDMLNEQAWAVKHDGDTYFKDAQLDAWELKYRLDNVQWSQRVCTVIEDKNDGYKAMSLGTVDINDETYILWDASEFTEDYGFTRMVSLTMEVGAEMWIYDPATGEKGEDVQTSIATIIDEYTEDGKGTITWMKDEHGNECPYDFKNIQFKRWKATDKISGRNGINGLYMVTYPAFATKSLNVDDTEDYIWAYTFSSDNSGGDQTDFSLGGHNVHDNVFKPYGDLLPNNVMFGVDNYGNSFGLNCYNNSWGNGCYDNSWGNVCCDNSWGNGCYGNSLGNNCYGNSLGNNCYGNSWDDECYFNSCGNSCNGNSLGNSCSNNSLGNNCYGNSWGNGCQQNSLGNNCCYNSLGNNCHYNSWGNVCCDNSWGNDCSHNSWGNNVTYSTVFDSVQHTLIITDRVLAAQVLNGVRGTYSSKLTLTFAADKVYTQVACLTSAGALKIYVPGDLA